MSQKRGVDEHSEIALEPRSVEEVSVSDTNVPAVNSTPAPRRKTLDLYLKKYTACTLFASLGGFVFGFDTGSIGPITVMDQFLEVFPSTSATLQGLIVSSILITGATASLFAGPLADRISRIYTFTVGGFIFALGSALSASSATVGQMIAGRLIAGAGEGLFLSGIIVYQCEIAPSAIRGTLASTLQLLITIGVASGYFVCYGTVKFAGSMAWRLPFILQCVVSTIFALGSPFLIHSPRWLTHVGRHEEAMRAWTRLGLNPTEAEKEEGAAINLERTEASQKGNWRQELRMMWAKDVRRRTFLGCFLMGMQQLSGIDGVLYYAPTLFAQAGLSSAKAAFLASGVSGLLNVGCTIITQPFQDKWGRRPAVLIGGSVIALCMLSIGAIYASAAHNTSSGHWAVIILIYIFVIAFSMSWAITNRIYASEIQPMKTRAAATSLGQAANWVVNWVVAFTTPLFLKSSGSGPYFLFGTCTALTVVVAAAFLPETKGVSLEKLDSVFKESPWSVMTQDMARTRRHKKQRSNTAEVGSTTFEDIEMALPSLPKFSPPIDIPNVWGA